MRPFAVVAAIWICFMCTSIADSAQNSPRQYYSSWNKHPSRDYYYRHLYYKPRANYVGYKHHYCLYYKSRPKYVYFYSPYSKKYWGRCEVNHGGKYSMLAEAERKSQLTDIPESAFPEASDPPPLPDAEDGISLDLPPDDLPLS